MIEEKVINSIGSLFDITFPDSIYDMTKKVINSAYIFRGEPSENNSLLTSFSRNYGNRYEIEKRLIINFHKYGQIIENKLHNTCIWEQLIFAQHHGVPTRLLDWTFSPIVALHFAILDKYNTDENCAIWAIKISSINNTLPPKYRDALSKTGGSLFTLELIKSLACDLDEYDSEMSCNSFITLEPPSIDQRIVNQYALFTVQPTGINSLSDFLSTSPLIKAIKIVIPAELKWELRCILDRINVNERVLYPGLDGLAAWLKRYYCFH